MDRGRLRLIDTLRKTKVYALERYKSISKRLNWEQIEAEPQKEKKAVVKGTSKRVVVVRSPDPKIFEEAIFIVREDFARQGGRINALKEAQQAASAYIRGAASRSGRRFRLGPLIWAFVGALLSAAALLALRLI